MLVVIVVFVFLGSLRATVIPAGLLYLSTGQLLDTTPAVVVPQLVLQAFLDDAAQGFCFGSYRNSSIQRRT